MSKSYDVSGRADAAVAVGVLRNVFSAARELGIRATLIGAVARDLVLHVTGASAPRATTDVDVAVAVKSFDSVGRLAAAAGGEQVGVHRIRLFGCDIDLVPYGPIEAAPGQVRLSRDLTMDVTGLAGAATNAWSFGLEPGVWVPVASLASQTVLKILAWGDRGLRIQSKDATDLGLLLNAATDDPYVGEVWEDEASLAYADHDIYVAAAHRLGRCAAKETGAAATRRVLAIVDGPGNRDLLARSIGGVDPDEMLSGYCDGLLASLP